MGVGLGLDLLHVVHDDHGLRLVGFQSAQHLVRVRVRDRDRDRVRTKLGQG